MLSISLIACLLISCGQAEPKLVQVNALETSDVIRVMQVNDDNWTLENDTVPQTPVATLSVGQKIAVQFSVSEDIHTLSIPEIGVRLEAVPGQIVESWVVVNKPVDVILRCENHPKEETGLSLRFE